MIYSNTFQYISTHCHTLQYIATYFKALQYIAIHGDIFQHIAIYFNKNFGPTDRQTDRHSDLYYPLVADKNEYFLFNNIL